MCIVCLGREVFPFLFLKEFFSTFESGKHDPNASLVFALESHNTEVNKYTFPYLDTSFSISNVSIRNLPPSLHSAQRSSWKFCALKIVVGDYPIAVKQIRSMWALFLIVKYLVFNSQIFVLLIINPKTKVKGAVEIYFQQYYL